MISRDEVETYNLLTGKWLNDRLWWARARDPESGTPVSVNFDANQVLSRESMYGDVIGFYHTHPFMLAFPSNIDIITMNAWVICLGKPLLCLIEGNDGLKTYYWHGDNIYSVGDTVKFGNLYIGKIRK